MLARARAELADDGGSLRVVGVALPEFLAALSDAPLDEVFLVYDTVRSEASSEARQANSVRRRTDSVRPPVGWRDADAPTPGRPSGRGWVGVTVVRPAGRAGRSPGHI